MPWKTLCGFPPTKSKVKLLIPNGAWREDTVITDTEGNEYFVVLELDTSMRTYEAVFADLDGNKLVCIKRHVTKAFWKDGYYFCTYRPNYKNQKPYGERDLGGKKLYPHSYMEMVPLKGRFRYRFVDNDRQLTKARLVADNQWMGFMMGCCTCCMRCGRFAAKFQKRDQSMQVFVDQWRNIVKVAPHNDLLAALCIAYVFDKCQNQPMVTMVGGEEEDYGAPDPEDDMSIDSGSSDEEDENGNKKKQVELENMDKFKDDVEDDVDDDATAKGGGANRGLNNNNPQQQQQQQQQPPDMLDGIPDGSPAAQRNPYLSQGTPAASGGASVHSRQSQLSHPSQQKPPARPPPPPPAALPPSQMHEEPIEDLLV